MAEPLPDSIVDQVVARFPGIDVACDFVVSWSWGIQPDVHVVETTQNHLPSQDIGTLSVIGQNSGRRLDLPNCRVVKIATDDPGRIAVHFEDRRWAWATGSIDGDYNDFNLGTLQYVRPKTAPELAALCLNAMKEVGYDVSLLPPDAKPRKQWHGYNPAQELEILAAEYGLVVVLDPITNRVRLCRPGQGELIEDRPSHRRIPAIVAAPIPSQIRVVGATALFQSSFPLGRPLARELDGRLVYLEDVSYTPGSGWGGVSPWSFTQINGSTVINGERIYHRDLAQESVWRYYELDHPIGFGGWNSYIFDLFEGIFGRRANAPDEFPPWLLELYNLQGRQRIFAFGPFANTILEKDPFTDSRLPPYIFAQNAFDAPDAFNKPAFSNWSGELSFPDPDRPVIRTTKPLFRYSNESWAPARAAASVVVAHAIKIAGVPVRYEQWLDNTIATPAGPLLEYHDDIAFEYVQAAARIQGVGVKSNLDKCKTQASYYLSGLAQTLVARQGETVQFPGLYLGASLDGAIRRLVWSGGPGVDPTTTVARNNEPNPFVQPWEKRPARVAQKIAEAQARRALANQAIAQRKLQP